MCVVLFQFTREAHFTGEGYLGLKMENVLDLPDDFYAGIGFRTDQQNGLMFYHQGQVQITLITVSHIKSYFEYTKHTMCLSLQNDVCQVVLDSGHVVVSTTKNGVRSQKTYNDDNSHYVAFYRNRNGYATLCFL